MRLIDADALTAAFAADSVKFKTEEFHVSAVETEIENAPTIDVTPVVHARWIEDDETQTCSNCGEEHEWGDYRASYCDTCGARMDEEHTNV